MGGDVEGCRESRDRTPTVPTIQTKAHQFSSSANYRTKTLRHDSVRLFKTPVEKRRIQRGLGSGGLLHKVYLVVHVEENGKQLNNQ